MWGRYGDAVCIREIRDDRRDAAGGRGPSVSVRGRDPAHIRISSQGSVLEWDYRAIGRMDGKKVVCRTELRRFCAVYKLDPI